MDERPDAPEPGDSAGPQPEAKPVEAKPSPTPPKALTSAAPPPVPSWRRPKPGALARRPEPGDHVAFHGTVARAMAGAGIGAVVADGLAWTLGSGLWDSPVLAFGVLGGALAAVAARGKRWWRAAIGGGVGLLAATLYTLAAPHWWPFAAALMGVTAAAVLAEGQSKPRQAVTAGLAAIAGSAGLFVARVMLGWDVFDGVVPSLLGHAAAGASAGLFVGLAAAPKFLGRPPDPVESAYHPALAIKDGEVHEILSRTLEIHRSLKGDLVARVAEAGLEGDAASMTKIADREQELVLRILHIASECRQIRGDLDATPASEIEARIADLSKRSAAASDAGARRTYDQAVASLEEQLEALGRIENGRERVVARLHATVALLEKLRFALIHLRSANAERVGGELPLVTEALDALTDELEATSSAVGEVYGGARPELEAGDAGADVLALPGSSARATGTDRR